MDAAAVAAGAAAGPQPPRRRWPVPTNPIRPSLQPGSRAGSPQPLLQGLRATRANRSAPPRPPEQSPLPTPCSSSPREGMATASGVSTGPVLQLSSLRPRRSAVSLVCALVLRCDARHMFALTPVKCLTCVGYLSAGACLELAAVENSRWACDRYPSACIISALDNGIINGEFSRLRYLSKCRP